MTKLSEQELILKVDQFYREDLTEQGHKLISEYLNSTNPQVLWRLARSCRYMIQRVNNSELRKKLAYDVREYGKRALELDNTCSACHKVLDNCCTWYCK